MALPHFACRPCSSYCFENALPQQGECSRSTCLLTFGLALWLRNQSSVALPRTAPSGGGNGGAAGRSHRVAGIAHGGLAVEEVADLLARQGLVFQEAPSQGLELVLLLGQNAAGIVEPVLDQAADFRVDLLGRRL